MSVNEQREAASMAAEWDCLSRRCYERGRQPPREYIRIN
ncbi:hypothetical protein GECvBN6_gp186c [Salmonella phage GEC_vB_N6]|uniref:Uncharacterized protein n=3 Tax=unclassified Kuttervirus TaxID=2770329 RepID=A0AAU8GJL6_9CAUD|nr:hypothetical protein GECvBN6_gp186c [Salmonella phage GEC_vB_N6]